MLRHQWLMLCVLLGTVALNVYLYIIVPKGFFPQQDTGRLGGQTVAAQDISFPAMRDKQRQLAQMTLDDPAVHSVTAFAGGGRNSNNVGFMFIAPQAAQPAPRTRLRRPGGQPPSRQAHQRSRRQALLSRPSRIFRSADAAARRNTSTRSRTKI